MQVRQKLLTQTRYYIHVNNIHYIISKVKFNMHVTIKSVWLKLSRLLLTLDRECKEKGDGNEITYMISLSFLRDIPLSNKEGGGRRKEKVTYVTAATRKPLNYHYISGRGCHTSSVKPDLVSIRGLGMKSSVDKFKYTGSHLKMVEKLKWNVITHYSECL